MLELKDFFHLPQLDALVEQLVADGPGLIVVAGLDPRPPLQSGGPGDFLPSGRSTVFRILMRHFLTTHPAARAIVVTESKDVIRVPRQLWRRVKISVVRPSHDYAERIAEAIRRQPELLVIDRLCPKTAALALEAAQSGLRVWSQLDTVFRGADIARALVDLGVPHEWLGSLSWIVAVQRLTTLCSQCKQAVPPTPRQLAELQRRYPELAYLQKGPFLEARGCPSCHYTGRAGDVAAFDIFRAEANGPDIFRQSSLLPLERYVIELAMAGYLALDDVLNLETDQLRRTYTLLTASERALSEANTALQRKLVELEASNQVLQQRTKALISLQGIGQALITIVGLKDLAQRICRYTRELCSADRVILYYLRAADIAEVLAFSGWPPARVPQQVEASLVFDPDTDINTEPRAFDGWPPGIPPRPPDVEGAILEAGLRVPLVAQDKLVGVMIVHSTHKSSFQPDETALLQTFAYQAALAIQRAGLIEELRDKITQLEAAQVELVKKERMEQELELARRVQQSVLPRTFPQIPGCQFAAYNEPARRVGGDFYDVISLDPDHCGVVIADVSDKGMPAALYMALTRSLILAEARRERSPRAVLLNINQLLLELGEPGMFVTVFYGVIEKATRRMTYVRAGHDYPLLLRDGTVQELGGEGTLLGFLDQTELHLSEETILLNPHDRLVLYTDGLTDVLSPDGERFALNRLKTLCQTHVNLPPAEFCSAVFAGLNAYQGGAEQFDDMTMLVIDVKRT